MTDPNPTILIVDKFQANRDLLREVLGAAGYRCLVAADGLEALQTFRRERPELVVTSVALLILSGIELLREIRREDPDAAVIVMSSEMDPKTVAAARDWDAFALVRKPVIIDELLIKAERALERRQLLSERRKYSLISSVGRDDAIRQLLSERPKHHLIVSDGRDEVILRQAEALFAIAQQLDRAAGHRPAARR